MSHWDYKKTHQCALCTRLTLRVHRSDITMHTMHSGRMDIFQTPMGATLQTNVHHNSIAAFDFFIKPSGAPSYCMSVCSKLAP